MGNLTGILQRNERRKKLEVELSDDEVLKKLEKAAANYKELLGLKEEKKKSNDQFSGDIKRIEAENKDLLVAAHDGKEMQEVGVIEEWDYNLGNVTLIRLDTHAKVDEWPIPPDERQPPLI